jgi:hypothetical protein
MKDAKGHGSDARNGGASAAPAYDGKPTWHGVMPGGGKVTNSAGNKIAYASPEAAIAGAAHQAGVQQVGTAPNKVLPKESTDSRELRLFADNNADLYRQSMQPIRDNLGKKMDKGVYDPAKAATLWKYHADRAAQAYTKQIGSDGPHGSHGNFSPAVRREAAQHWEADERDDIKSGSSRTHKG